MGATIVKIKNYGKDRDKKPLSPLQKKLIAGLVMSDEEYKEFKKVNTWMRKWKI